LVLQKLHLQRTFSVFVSIGCFALKYPAVLDILQDGWLLDRRVVEGYLTEVEGVYKANPYHNNTHAADVTQTAGVIMTALNQWLCTPIINCINNSSGNGGRSINNCGCFSPVSGSVQPCDNSPTPLVPAPANSAFVQNSGSNSSHGGGAAPASGPGLRKIERFAIILASAIHDLGHPGVNNAFLVRTRDQQAVIYNDKSVNEMMHASLAFQIAQDNPEIDIFARFSQEEYELVSAVQLVPLGGRGISTRSVCVLCECNDGQCMGSAQSRSPPWCIITPNMAAQVPGS